MHPGIPLSTKFFRMPVFAAILATFFLLSGCGGGTYGRFDFQMAVNELFESGTILDNHSYYYIGPDAEPDAIMALDNIYQLAPSLWKKIDITPDQLVRWMERIDNKYRFKNMYHGAVIDDGHGNRLGVWYSRLTKTVIHRGEGNQVIIYTPDTTYGLDDKGPLDIWGVR
ncbi:MAG: hypothetical protein V1706_04475 [Pseudomonadota bacterium]